MLLDESNAGAAPIAADGEDRSMALFEYSLAIIAVVAAFLLAVVR